MTIELDQTTFRRLVQLNLIGLLLWIPIFWVDLTSITWTVFSGRFDELVMQEFGRSSFDNMSQEVVLVGLIFLFIWMIASAVGLLWFFRWARFGFWFSIVVATLGMMFVDGNRPSYTTPFQDVVAMLESMIAGAIVVMSYAKGCGAEWFAPGGYR